jgi:uncharacterized NAD(P)/FAD-binding protein YdhS
MFMSEQTQPQAKTIAIVGAGFAGTLLALKLAKLRPDLRIYLIEKEGRMGRGLAYGACAPYHLLNVPIPRMEVGLTPPFTEWLKAHPELLGEAMTESGGDPMASYVSRAAFGKYLEERLREAMSPDRSQGVIPIRGDVVGLLDRPERGVLMHDGRTLTTDILVLATGNLPPRAPYLADDWLYDSFFFTPDPWTHDALDRINADAPVILLGTGLTMVDVALKLAAQGHVGKMYAVSRRGLMPSTHKSGGSWEPFLAPLIGASPLAVLRAIREQARKADEKNISWQRVIDAVRPFIARIWHSWSTSQRGQFLRHARARWDVHRHRMAPRVSDRLHSLINSGQLKIMAGRVQHYRPTATGVEALVSLRGQEKHETYPAARVINCTGPRSDLDRLAIPLISDLKSRGLIAPDPLGLGIETDDCAAIDQSGRASTWLYALGPLTRPAWWEITAVPEITAQVDRLAQDLAVVKRDTPAQSLALALADLGAGI